jgi:ArsR family transcriptional regulator
MGADQAQDMAKVFKALASPARLQLVGLLGKGDACVCDLVDEVGLSQPTVSHHLRVLAEAGLVTSSREGTWVWYSLVSERFDVVSELLGRQNGD